MDISNVPPPRSYTAITPSFFSLSKPKAKAAAVGSLIILSTLSPAILPAASVAFLCESLKYAGTVTTALSTLVPRYSSAVFFIFLRISADTCGGAILFPSTSTHASPFSASTIPYGTDLRSF